MRSSVTKWSYLLRKKVEGFLYKLIPQSVIPLYTMVSFTRIPYSQALARNRKQTEWFNFAGNVAAYGTLAVAGVAGLWYGLRASGVKYITYAVQSGKLLLLS
jgi:kynurenine 3-monooxygenase